jgi:glycosyltransferase involved in cell wall biosynthesis
MPNSLLEAIACGLAVIASRIPGVTEIVGEEEARLVTVGDVSELATALEQLIRSRELRETLGWRARELATRRFDRAAIVDRYWDVYAGLLAPGGAEQVRR